MRILSTTTGTRAAASALAAVLVLSGYAGYAGASQAKAGVSTAAVPASSVVTSNQIVPDSDATSQLVTAEASNGDIALAVSAGPADDDIDIAKVGHAPALFDTVPAGTVALAFTPRYLFMAGPSAISSVRRSNGALVRTWTIKVSTTTEPGRAMVYGDGRLWIVGSDGHGAKIFEINPASLTVTTIASGRNIGSIAAGPRGVYYVPSGGHKIVRVSSAGHTTTKPTHESVDVAESGAGAVHVMAVDGAQVIVAHDYGQGFDAGILRFSASTLARESLAGSNVALTRVVPTTDGDGVLLTGSGSGGCAYNKACIASIDTKSAVTSDPVHLPKGLVLSVLLGPHPAVVVGHAHHAHLLRLGAL